MAVEMQGIGVKMREIWVGIRGTAVGMQIIWVEMRGMGWECGEYN